MLDFVKPDYNKHKLSLTIGIIILLGVVLRLYHINFGLPHSFTADEPEIAEYAIHYTYELKSIIADTEYYKLIPTSYVYGQFPVYVFTVLTIIFSKALNILAIPFDKTDLYVFMRIVNALISVSLIPTTILIYKKVFSREGNPYIGYVFSGLLLSLNWKLIVHAHYLNMDIILTVLLSLSYLTFLAYIGNKENSKRFTILTAVLLGLAIGTKVTAAISLPLYVAIYLINKDFRHLVAFIFIIFGVFIVSNPFSYVFANDFVYRVYLLSVKENGLVFDSVDFGLFKYLYGLSYMVTIPVFVSFLYGGYVSLCDKSRYRQNLLLLGTVLIYIVFYSLGTRRVDRWLLPILPIVFLYASLGIVSLKLRLNKFVFLLILAIISFVYMYYPVLLIRQYDRYTPKARAYIWMRDNLVSHSKKLIYTQEGLDPMNKLDFADVKQFNVYESEGAQFFVPEDPSLYDYVVISSRPLSIYSKDPVKYKYPFYYEKWKNFEDQVLNPEKFVLVKAYILPKPNLLDVSDVYIYESVVPVTRDKPAPLNYSK